MKKLYVSLLALIACGALHAQTPIVLDDNDFAGEGESFNTVNANPVIIFDGTETGADYNWDFSDLTTLSESVTNFVDPSDTDPLYFFLWLASDVAQQTTADIVNDFITIEDIFNFYKLDNSEFSMTGFAGTIAGVPLPILYNDPEIIYEFPSAYNDVTTSESGFNISVPGFGGWNEHRYRTNENDGWGSLTTPVGTYDVLRTRSEIAIVDTFTYDVFEIPFAYTSIEYRWMAKSNGMPILQINSQEILGTETITQVNYKVGDVVDGIVNQNNATTDLTVSPNPAENTVNISFTASATHAYTLLITDINGKNIIEKNITALNGNNSIHTDLQSLTAGTYFITLTENGKFIATQKIIKQ